MNSVLHGNEIEAEQNEVVLGGGDGSTVWDIQDRVYLDAHAGAWLCQIGHGRSEMAEVARAQIQRLEHFTTRREYGNKPALDLASKLVEMVGLPGGKLRYSTSGSEANDDALQIVREYQRRRGLPDKRKILTLSGAFHGHSLAGRQLAGEEPSPEVVPLRSPDPFTFSGLLTN